MKRILLAVFAALVAAPLLAAFPTPVAHWSGKITDGKVADLSGNGVTLTPGEGVTVVDDAEMGEVLAFSGLSNGWAQASVRFPHINARTIAMWIRREATIPLSGNSYPHIFGALCGLNCSWYLTDDKVRLALTGTPALDDNIYSKIAMSFPAEEWHFMVWTMNPTGTANQYEVAGYLDGVQVGTTQTLTFSKSIDYSDPETQTDYVVLGNNAKANNRGFYGQVKDVRIYGVALTQNQQTKLWLDAKALLPRKAIGYWPLETITGEEGAGKARATPDLSGNGHDLTCGGTDIAVVKGIQGNCFSLTAPFVNASNGNVGYGGLTFLANRVIGPYTLSMWIRRDQFEEVKNGPRLFADWAAPTLQLQFDALTGKRMNVSWDGKNHYTTADAVRRGGEWSFLTVVFDTAYDAETDAYSGKHAFYMDGEPVSYSADEVFSTPRFPLKKSSRFIFCSNVVPPAQGTRNFPGCIDEIRMIEGALTADEVKALYRGAAMVDAGADFAVTGEKAVLRGEVASRGVDFGMQTGYAGAVRWELVSAPDGGEDVVFARQENPVCEVTLPVAGAYVFRLSTVAGFLSQADEVTVTRESSASEQPPTVTGVAANPSAVAYSGVSALSATVSAGARVVWSKVSGPGAVLFQPANAAKTVAAFTATGDYVLRCTAETDAGTAFQDVPVAVSAAFAAGGVTTGLLAAWTFDDTIAESISGSSGLIYSNATNISTYRYVPGAVGTSVGMSGYYEYHNTGVPMPYGTDTFVDKTEPSEAERYRTISLWIYADSAMASASETTGAYIINQDNNLILQYYTPKAGTNAGRFAIYQVTALNEEQGLPNGSGRVIYFSAPSVPVLDRWAHLTLVLDRKNYSTAMGSGARMWVDDEQLVAYSGSTQNARMNAVNICFGGKKKPNDQSETTAGKWGYWESDTVSRKFPGLIDEVRIYDRALSVGEIAYLSANPACGNLAPGVDAPSVPAKFLKKQATAVSAVAGDDGQVETLTCRWEVVKGDASKVEFADPTALETTVTVAEAGDYAFRLVAFDGERTTYGESVEVTVEKPGCVILLR